MEDRERALDLLNEYVKSESLRKHCLSVALAMEEYALKFGEDIEKTNNLSTGLSIFSNGSNLSSCVLINGSIHKDKFWVCGLLHDFDYEKFPELDKHAKEGCEILGEMGYDATIITAILGHNYRTGVKRESLMSRTLFAVDELCGLIIALSYVRPNRFEGMSAKSVRKVLKKKDFAKGVNRDEIQQGILELGVDETEHFELVIGALRNGLQ